MFFNNHHFSVHTFCSLLPLPSYFSTFNTAFFPVHFMLPISWLIRDLFWLYKYATVASVVPKNWAHRINSKEHICLLQLDLHCLDTITGSYSISLPWRCGHLPFQFLLHQLLAFFFCQSHCALYFLHSQSWIWNDWLGLLLLAFFVCASWKVVGSVIFLMNIQINSFLFISQQSARGILYCITKW